MNCKQSSIAGAKAEAKAKAVAAPEAVTVAVTDKLQQNAGARGWGFTRSTHGSNSKVGPEGKS